MQYENSPLRAATGNALRASGQAPDFALVRVTALACLIVLALSRGSYAAGGYGSVWTDEVASSSITIDWSDPTGSLRYVSGTPTFQICYKVSGDVEGACNGGTVIGTTQKPYQLNNLQSNTSYKIKVLGLTEHKNMWGNWGNPEFRKAGTLTQSTTLQSTPPAISVSITGTSASGLDVEVTVPNPQDYEFIRVCYKSRSNLTLAKFSTTCKGYDGPPLGWGGSDANLGWVELPPTGVTTMFSLQGLRECRQFEVCAYGFAPGPAADGTLIGKAKAHTGTGCRTGAPEEVPRE